MGDPVPSRPDLPAFYACGTCRLGGVRLYHLPGDLSPAGLRCGACCEEGASADHLHGAAVPRVDGQGVTSLLSATDAERAAWEALPPALSIAHLPRASVASQVTL